jgi:hypothetical protein
MRTIYTLLIGITFGLTSKAIYAAPVYHPFTKPSTNIVVIRRSEKTPKIVSLEGNRSSNKVILKWQVADNEGADQFEVERSSDGKNFSTAAFVFATEKSGTDAYLFYEKSNGKQISYRIKIVNKDRQATYSNVLTIAK